MPRDSQDLVLLDEIANIPTLIEDLPTLRREVAENISRQQRKQKHHFDRKLKRSTKYEVGQLVLIAKHEITQNTSRKLIAPYVGQSRRQSAPT